MATVRGISKIDYQDIDDAVHRMRKTLKRARAALRLERATLGDAAYRDADRQLRDAGRPLTVLRDAAALMTTLEALQKPAEKRNAGSYSNRMRRHLQEEHLARRDQFAATDLHSSAEILRNVRHRARSLAGGPDAPSSRVGILRTYRSGRKAMAKVRRHPTTLMFHEWRKQAKYLANELDLAPRLLRSPLDKMRKHANRLAAALGDDHDLALLRVKLQELHARGAPPDISGRRKFQHRIKRHRRKLQKKALHLGHRLYANPVTALDRKLAKLLAG